jgi:hypothetical protein
MKNTKKLFSAVVMLALSAVMLVTSSFAWFSMNTEVYANNMSVTAKGDQVYLEIINSSQTFAEKPGQTEVDAATKLKENLQPVAVVKSIAGDKKTVTNYDGEGAIVWVTNTSAAMDSSTAVRDYADVTTTVNAEDQTTNNYCLVNTFKIRLNEDAGATSADPLTVRGVSFATAPEGTDTFAKCVSVLVVCGENSQLWTQSTLGSFAKVGDANLYANDGKFDVTNDTGVEVKVYVFFNGLDAACTIANLNAGTTANNYKVQVNFTVQA